MKLSSGIKCTLWFTVGPWVTSANIHAVAVNADDTDLARMAALNHTHILCLWNPQTESETSWTVALSGTESAVMCVNISLCSHRTTNNVALQECWRRFVEAAHFCLAPGRYHGNVTFSRVITTPGRRMWPFPLPLTRTVGTKWHECSLQYSVVYRTCSWEWWSLMVQDISNVFAFSFYCAASFFCDVAAIYGI